MMLIRLCEHGDIGMMHTIINDAATAYKGVIPDDRYHEPYMGMKELVSEIGQGVTFWGAEEDGVLLGVMGIQDKGEVSLIRHAYVSTAYRSKGIGGSLLHHLMGQSAKPILIGTWETAGWAIRFYRRHGFELASDKEKRLLLKRYWTIPKRQIDTSVVLFDGKWAVSRYRQELAERL